MITDAVQQGRLDPEAAQAARKTAVRLRFDMFPEPSSVTNGQASHLHQQHTSLCKLINCAGRYGRVTGGQSQQTCTASTETLICAGEKEAISLLVCIRWTFLRSSWSKFQGRHRSRRAKPSLQVLSPGNVVSTSRQSGAQEAMQSGAWIPDLDDWRVCCLQSLCQPAKPLLSRVTHANTWIRFVHPSLFRQLQTAATIQSTQSTALHPEDSPIKLWDTLYGLLIFSYAPYCTPPDCADVFRLPFRACNPTSLRGSLVACALQVSARVTCMPSPSAQSRSARRLPSRLRNSPEAEPTGELKALREAATAKARSRKASEEWVPTWSADSWADTEWSQSSGSVEWWHHAEGYWSQRSPRSEEQWQEELQTIQEERTQDVPEEVTASRQMPAARVGDHGLTQLKHAEMARKRLEALPANEAYIVAKFLPSLPPPPEQPARVTPSGTVTAANIQQQCKPVTRTVSTQTCVNALDASTQAGEPQLEMHQATSSEYQTDEAWQPDPPQQFVETQLLSAAYEAGQMVQMVHVDTLDNALSPAAAALLPALMGNLQSALPRLATLMNWLSVMQADGHMVRSQEHGHYTALHSILSTKLSIWRWETGSCRTPLFSLPQVSRPDSARTGLLAHSLRHGWCNSNRNRIRNALRLRLPSENVPAPCIDALTPANQSRELYDRFRWKAGRNSCWETLHKMAGCRLDGNLLTWTAETEHHCPVGVAFSSLPMQVLTFTQEEAIDSPAESDQEVHKTGPRPVSPTEGWPRLCDSESSLTDARSPTRKGERSPLPDGSAKQNAQAKSVTLQAACPSAQVTRADDGDFPAVHSDVDSLIWMCLAYGKVRKP